MKETAGYGPEYDEYVEHVRKDVLPKMENISLFVSITPNSEKIDIKFATEMGIAILMDKPIVAIIRRGQDIPKKLSRVVDRFIEVDDNYDPTVGDRIKEAIKEMVKPND
jgi:hypothetical protein